MPEPEYELLRRRARSEHLSIQELVRQAIRRHVLEDRVDPSDPIFRELARPRGSRGKDRSALHVDELLDTRP